MLWSASRWGFKYDQYFFDKFFQLFHASNGYLALDSSDNWVINTRQGIRSPIYKGFTGTILCSYDYNNDPPPEAKADHDSSLSFPWATNLRTKTLPAP